MENVVSGRSTWRWRAAAASARARRRYVRVQSALRDAHSDLAALHFAHFLADADDTDTSEAQEPGETNLSCLSVRPLHYGRKLNIKIYNNKQTEKRQLFKVTCQKNDQHLYYIIVQ